jgi:hypothetical protein
MDPKEIEVQSTAAMARIESVLGDTTNHPRITHKYYYNGRNNGRMHEHVWFLDGIETDEEAIRQFVFGDQYLAPRTDLDEDGEYAWLSVPPYKEWRTKSGQVYRNAPSEHNRKRKYDQCLQCVLGVGCMHGAAAAAALNRFGWKP